MFALGCVIGSAAGLGLFAWHSYAYPRCKQVDAYLNPQTGCLGEQIINKSSYDPLRENLLRYIAEKHDESSVAQVSVFFRDLSAGPTMSINASEDFAPASILKVPLALAYLRMEEDNPGILQDKIRYTRVDSTLHQMTPPRESLALGQWYTVEEALRYMLVYSDNIALGVLSEYLKSLPEGPTYLQHTYQELGIVDPADATDETLSVHGYASIFRALYNASYLDAELSSKMLRWLAEADFAEGIRGGVPSSVPVANKFGERLFPDGTIQLHDCGIVYFPENPYSLCIMTQGHDWQAQAAVIQDISEQVYFEVFQRRI